MAEYRKRGSAGYLFSIVLVAVLGGLLFGYDTAVISGAEKGLQNFFQSASDFTYTNGLHGFTTSSALIGCVIGALLSGIMAARLGRKKSLFIAGILFLLSALGSYHPEFLIFAKGVPTKGLLAAFNFYRILGAVGVGHAQHGVAVFLVAVDNALDRTAEYVNLFLLIRFLVVDSIHGSLLTPNLYGFLFSRACGAGRPVFQKLTDSQS